MVHAVERDDARVMDTDTATMGTEPRPGHDDMNDDTAPTEPGPTNAEAPGGPAFPPPLPAPSARRSWWHTPVARDRDNRKISGVVAGIARAYGFDRRTTRIAVALAACVMPAIIAIYIAAIIILPRTPAEALPLRDVILDRRRSPLLIAIGIVIAATGFGAFGTWLFLGGYGWGVALITLGVVLWIAPNFGTTKAAPALFDQRTTPTFPEQGWSANETSTGAAASPIGAPRRRRLPVQAVSLVIAATVALVAAVGDAAGWWNAEVLGVAIATLSILVVGSLVGIAVNRSWLGVPFMIVLIAMLGSLLITRPHLNGGIGERTLAPASAAEASVHQDLAFGQLTIDLTHTTLQDHAVTVDARVGFGRLHVIAPNDVAIRIVTHLGAGHVVVNGTEVTAGIRHDDIRTIAATGSGTSKSTIELDLEVGAGEISVATTA